MDLKREHKFARLVESDRETKLRLTILLCGGKLSHDFFEETNT